MAEPKMKGVMIYHMKKIIREEFGQDMLQNVIDECAPDVREVVSGAVMSTEWYTEKVCAEFVRASTTILGKNKVKVYTRKMVRTQLNSILKFILHIFSSPEMFSRNNPKLWHKIHDSGELELVKSDVHSHTMEIRDFDFINQDYLDTFLEYHCGILEAVGARNAVGVIRKANPGLYIFDFSWE